MTIVPGSGEEDNSSVTTILIFSTLAYIDLSSEILTAKKKREAADAGRFPAAYSTRWATIKN